MIEIKQDILTIAKGLIVHQVNCKAKMGSGLALQIRNKYPEVYDRYIKDPPFLGTVQIVYVTDELAVVNLAGQYDYGRDKQHTDYVAVERAMLQLSRMHIGENDTNIYIPFNMGCGLGGGDWKIYSAIIEKCIPKAIICKKE